jgi:hypothetical protein
MLVGGVSSALKMIGLPNFVSAMAIATPNTPANHVRAGAAMLKLQP